MRALSLLLSVLALVVPACGGDDGSGPPVGPVIIPGGGIHDPGIDGTVNVYVIDADTDLPLAGAEVEIGTLTGTTDATGLFVATGIRGPQTVVAKASGHATAMWVGADGANVTMPLDASPAPLTRPPQAQLTGSITGWAALPAPDLQRTRVALILFAQDPVLGSKANDLAQPPAMNSVPAAACVRTTTSNPPCAWKLNSRPGDLALGLVMIDVDNRGTADPTDDASVVTGYSVTPITVVAGANQTGVMVALPPVDSAVRPTVTLGTPPAALTQVQTVVGLDLGNRGVLRYPMVDPIRPGAVVPTLAIAAGAHYELLGLASEPVADGTAAQSIVLRRGLADVTTLAAGTWLPPPTGLASDRMTVSFTRGRPEGPYVVELINAGLGVEGRKVMSIAIFDDSSQVALPTAFAPLPGDPLTMKVTTIETAAALDLTNFEVDALTGGAVGFAADTIKLR